MKRKIFNTIFLPTILVLPLVSCESTIENKSIESQESLTNTYTYQDEDEYNRGYQSLYNTILDGQQSDSSKNPILERTVQNTQIGNYTTTYKIDTNCIEVSMKMIKSSSEYYKVKIIIPEEVTSSFEASLYIKTGPMKDSSYTFSLGRNYDFESYLDMIPEYEHTNIENPSVVAKIVLNNLFNRLYLEADISDIFYYAPRADLTELFEFDTIVSGYDNQYKQIYDYVKSEGYSVGDDNKTNILEKTVSYLEDSYNFSIQAGQNEIFASLKYISGQANSFISVTIPKSRSYSYECTFYCHENATANSAHKISLSSSYDFISSISFSQTSYDYTSIKNKEEIAKKTINILVYEMDSIFFVNSIFTYSSQASRSKISFGNSSSSSGIEQRLINYLSTYGPRAETGNNTSLLYYDGDYYVGYYSNYDDDMTIYLSVLFKYGSTTGSGTFLLKSNGVTKLLMDFSAYTSNHLYSSGKTISVPVLSISNDVYEEAAALVHLCTQMAINNATTYLENHNLPYIY